MNHLLGVHLPREVNVKRRKLFFISLCLLFACCLVGMNNTHKTYSRKFGNFQVDVNGSDICISSSLYGSNFGRFYPFAFERFKSHDRGEAGDWDRPQVLGMDWDLGLASPKSPIRGWLYGLIYSGKLDHLVAE